LIRHLPLLLLAGLLAEIASLVIVGRWIGVVPVLLLVIGAGIAGVSLIRAGGMTIAEALRRPSRLEPGPANPGLTGVFRAIAGLLLILPGFVSDIAAITLLFPPVQRMIAGFLTGFAKNPSPPSGQIIDAEAIEIEDQSIDSGVSRPDRRN
jgi:UPF0716 protein FxsA